MQSYLPSSRPIVCTETNVYKYRHYTRCDSVVFEFTSAISEAYAWTFVLILAAEGCGICIAYFRNNENRSVLVFGCVIDGRVEYNL